MDDELLRLRGDKKIPFFTLAKRMLSYAKHDWWKLLIVCLLMGIHVAGTNALPLLMKQFVGLFETESFAQTTMVVIVSWVLGYAGIALISLLIRFCEFLILQSVGQKIVYQLRMEVFTHIERMSQNQFNEMPVGALVTRVANYTAHISQLFTDVLTNLLSNILTIIVVYVIMCTISWRLSLVMLAFGVAIAFVTIFFGGMAGKLWRKQRLRISDLNTFLSENLSGMRIIQIFNAEKKKEREFNDKNEKLRKTAYGVNFAFTFYRPVIALLQYAATAVTFGVSMSGWLVGAAEVVAFYLYIANFFEPIQSFADQVNTIQSATTSCERLFNLLDVPPEVVDEPDAIEMDHFEGSIEFDHVWFAYEEENWILKDVSFKVEPKQTVAFVGATGAGKTTILSLIVRNYVPQKGRILIDGVDIRKIKIESLRRATGQMLQDVFLFSGTIRDNITIHDESFSDEQVHEAAEYVNATSFIDKLPNGLNTEVTERGENFSSGQRQLLSFARTVLHQPQILILDEATANIDTETETIIQASLAKMRSIGTMLVVAHRLSTIQHADNIIVLQNGEILEQGNHQALLHKKGHYHKLYQLQFEQE